MIPLHRDPHFTFRFADDRVIPRFHLEGVAAGRRVDVFRIDPVSEDRIGLLTTGVAGEGGWVGVAEPIRVRTGDAFVAVETGESVPQAPAPALTLLELAGRFAVCKLPPDSPIPAWATAGEVFAVTRTPDELSVVCRQEVVPSGTPAELDWRGVRVAGAMPFTLVGVLASLTAPIARAGVGVFAFSTFDTDILLVKAADYPTAVAALRAAGHAVERTPVTAAVRLRPVERGDLPWVYELQLDPESNRMAATIPRTKEALDAHWAKALGDPKVTARVILVGEQRVGLVSRFQRDGADHVGYWIDRAWWGRGVASRALQLLLEEVSDRPLIATAATGNAASLRVLRKCGFVVERVWLAPADDRHPACEEAVLVLRESPTATTAAS